MARISLQIIIAITTIAAPSMEFQILVMNTMKTAIAKKKNNTNCENSQVQSVGSNIIGE